MNYKQSLEYIHSTYKFGSKLGLQNITELMNRLGNPQEKLKIIHIAGTNGKGSTVSFIAKTLEMAGYDVGVFISPFLEVFNERIRINDVYISDDDLAQITSEVKKHVDDMLNDGYNHPTEFEIVTAIAFVYYYKMNVDYVVLEVGLGGRLDSTNVIKKPIMTVITPIALDHTQYLGETLYQIAGEKAGILKNDVPCVVYPQEKEALKRILEIAKEKNVSVKQIDLDVDVKAMSLMGSYFEYKGNDYKISLLGEHQIYNSILAINVLCELRDRKLCKITDLDIKNGLESTKWAGRFEKISENPLVILDGAHNLHGAKALNNAIDKYLKYEKMSAVIGILEDKSYSDIVDILAEKFSFVVVTEPDNPRALSMYKLGELIEKKGVKVYYEKDIHKALDKALSFLEISATVVFGSLYMIGSARTYLKDN